MKIIEIKATPVAFPDAPLLNSIGVHQPLAIRTIVEVVTDEGITGLGETYGDSAMVTSLRRAADAVVGLDPFNLNRLEAAVAGGGVGSATAAAMSPGSFASRADDRLYSALEVACLDIQGRALGRPVCDLLGGAARDAVPFAGYLFYKFGRHLDHAGDDRFGEVLDAQGVVRLARMFVEEHGFAALKLKGGVLRPEAEVDAMMALRDAFPGLPLRLDPNAAWTLDTAIDVARRLDGVLEYLEDPTGGHDGMAAVARAVAMPLATNMVVTGFADLPEAANARSCAIVLADHHYWGGLQRSRQLARVCSTLGLELGMHSNSHLGVSLAAMVHFAAAVPRLVYSYDTHYPWVGDDVIAGGKLPIVDGMVSVPKGPGLGVELDQDALARLHELYLKGGIRERDDLTEMRRYHPDWTGRIPRF